MATAQDVARRLAERMADNQAYLYRDEAASLIRREFGEDFLYVNQNGNWAIKRSVLDAFRKMTEDTVIWSRGYKAWRRRQEWDGPGRQSE